MGDRLGTLQGWRGQGGQGICSSTKALIHANDPTLRGKKAANSKFLRGHSTDGTSGRLSSSFFFFFLFFSFSLVIGSCWSQRSRFIPSMQKQSFRQHRH